MDWLKGPLGVWLMGLLIVLGNALVGYVQTNNVGVAVIDQVKAKVESKGDAVQKSVEKKGEEVKEDVADVKADVAKEAVASTVDGLKDKLAAMGDAVSQPAPVVPVVIAAPDAAHGLINPISPEMMAMIKAAFADLKAIRVAVESIEARVNEAPVPGPGPSPPLVEPSAGLEPTPADPMPASPQPSDSGPAVSRPISRVSPFGRR